MNEKNRKIRTFVIPTRSIKALGSFRQLIMKLNISDREKEEIIAVYKKDV